MVEDMAILGTSIKSDRGLFISRSLPHGHSIGTKGRLVILTKYSNFGDKMKFRQAWGTVL